MSGIALVVVVDDDDDDDATSIDPCLMSRITFNTVSFGQHASTAAFNVILEFPVSSSSSSSSSFVPAQVDESFFVVQVVVSSKVIIMVGQSI